MTKTAFELVMSMVDEMNQKLLDAHSAINAAATPDIRAAAQEEYDRIYAASFALVQRLKGWAK